VNCMKCGRDIEPEQVFCAQCLADMEKYPVRPGTAVQLPRRQETPLYRKVYPKRRPPTPEEQIRRLRKNIRRLWGCLIACFVIIALLIYPFVRELIDSQKQLPGQNYTSTSSVVSSDPTERDLP